MVGVMVCGSRTITDVKWVETQIVNYLKEVYADQEKRFGQGDMDFIIIQGFARGVDMIAKEAIRRKTGARALRSIVEEIMLDVMYDVPTKENIDKFVVTADMVKNRKNAEVVQLPKKDEQTKEIIA